MISISFIEYLFISTSIGATVSILLLINYMTSMVTNNFIKLNEEKKELEEKLEEIQKTEKTEKIEKLDKKKVTEMIISISYHGSC
jgi:uncharacterized membrane protein (DUF106 family)